MTQIELRRALGQLMSPWSALAKNSSSPNQLGAAIEERLDLLERVVEHFALASFGPKERRQ